MQADVDETHTPLAPITNYPAEADAPKVGTEQASWLERELIKEIAMDIGKEIAAYIEVMYPAAVKATSSTFLLSIRNAVHNEIMAALDATDIAAVRARLAKRKKFRRWWKAQYRAIREHEAR